jgi:hypothetical protein
MFCSVGNEGLACLQATGSDFDLVAAQIEAFGRIVDDTVAGLPGAPVIKPPSEDSTGDDNDGDEGNEGNEGDEGNEGECNQFVQRQLPCAVQCLARLLYEVIIREKLSFAQSRFCLKGLNCCAGPMEAA